MSITGLTGQKLGPYQLQGILAHGVHSVVYEARNRFLEGRFTVKVIHPDVLEQTVSLAFDPDRTGAPKVDALARCRRDSDLAAALRHASIVRILEWSRAAALPLVYLVSELCPGEDVHSRIRRRGRLTAGQARELGLRVSMTLAAVHKLGVAHRGLTPRNLHFTITPKGEELCRIRDFGLAHLPLLPGVLHEVTPYLAPELFAAAAAGTIGVAGTDDTRADQFSLAAILFEALTGQPPPAYDEIALVSAPPPLPLRSLCPDLPPFLVQAIERALSPIHNERFATMEDFTRALDNRAPGLRLSGNPLPPSFSRAALRQSLSGNPSRAPSTSSAHSATTSSGRTLPALYSSRDAVVSGGSPLDLGREGRPGAAAPGPGRLPEAALEGQPLLLESEAAPRSGRVPLMPIAGVTMELETIDILEHSRPSGEPSGPLDHGAEAALAIQAAAAELELSPTSGETRPSGPVVLSPRRRESADVVPRLRSARGQHSQVHQPPGADPALLASGRLSPLTLTSADEERSPTDSVALPPSSLSPRGLTQPFMAGAPSSQTARLRATPEAGGERLSQSGLSAAMAETLARGSRSPQSLPAPPARSARSDKDGLRLSQRGEAPSSASALSLSQAAGQRASAASRSPMSQASLRRRRKGQGQPGAVLAGISLIVLVLGGLYLITSARLRQHLPEPQVAEHESRSSTPTGDGAASTRAAAGAPQPGATVDPQVLLDQAEQALAQSEPRRAIDLARQALPSLRAWRIIALAACRSADAPLLSQAQAQLSELERRDVESACRR